ncbi:staphopain proregion domain-containing protein [Staphylococcus aureus]
MHNSKQLEINVKSDKVPQKVKDLAQQQFEYSIL